MASALWTESKGRPGVLHRIRGAPKQQEKLHALRRAGPLRRRYTTDRAGPDGQKQTDQLPT